ncbi:unnamed protein product, partial [Staurois parvus]
GLLPHSPLRIGTFGERVPEFDRYPLPLPGQLPRRLEAEGVLPPSLWSFGTRDRSQKTVGPFTKHSKLLASAVGKPAVK